MGAQTSTTVYRDEYGIEAFCLQGYARAFPPHVHDHYVIGLMVQGKRELICLGTTYELNAGDIMLLNPGDSHACTHASAEPLDYRGFNIPRTAMRALLGYEPPLLGPVASRHAEATAPAASSPLVNAVLRAHGLTGPAADTHFYEEAVLHMLKLLPTAPQVDEHTQTAAQTTPSAERDALVVKQACAYMEQNLTARITLEDLCRHTGVSKSTLLRAFARERGITPYRYLESARVERAKLLLRSGSSPARAALATGFTDQSHLTNLFRRLTGLTPGEYRDAFKPKNGEAA